MADYIRFRLAAARVGVTMAFVALLAGLAEKARAATPGGAGASAGLLRPAPPGTFQRDISTPSVGGLDRVVIQKLDSALTSLEHKLNTSFTTTHKLNQTFLKIKSANTEFLKIKSADASFLKIDAANASFLKIDDANNEFLKIDSTAANASELGGLTPDAFFQGAGHVVSGSAAVTQGGPTARLLTLPGEIIVVNAVDTVGANLELVLQNNSSVGLPAVQDNAGQPPAAPFTIPANGGTVSVPVTTQNGAGQVHIQIFPAGAAFPDVVTIMVSSENLTGGSTQTLVGQAFTGVPS